MRGLQVIVACVMLAGCQPEQAVTGDIQADTVPGCEDIPRTANARLPMNEASDEWFRVYESSLNVYSIVEPYHFQETISHLIVGDDRALLFDTGMGFMPIRPVVERITHLPVTVLNSHTHYDHVGGNSEFSSILAIDSAYTRANMAGFAHDRLAADLRPDLFCKGTPEGFDPTTFRTRPWKATRYVADGDILDLGGRALEVLHVPGHTPDSVALLDAENGLIFTGDSYYDGTIWLFVPETSLVDYRQSVAELARLEIDVEYLLGAHNTVKVDAGKLKTVAGAIEKLVSGDVEPAEQNHARLRFDVNRIEFLTARPALQGAQRDLSEGGSGLDTWQ